MKNDRKQKAGGEPAFGGDRATDNELNSNNHSSTSPRNIQVPRPGEVWRNAEQRYYAKLNRRNGSKRFAPNSLDFYTLHNLAGPVAWAIMDTVWTLLNQLDQAELLKCNRQSSAIDSVVERVWSQMAMADYAPELLKTWGASVLDEVFDPNFDEKKLKPSGINWSELPGGRR